MNLTEQDINKKTYKLKFKKEIFEKEIENVLGDHLKEEDIKLVRGFFEHIENINLLLELEVINKNWTIKTVMVELEFEVSKYTIDSLNELLDNWFYGDL